MKRRLTPNLGVGRTQCRFMALSGRNLIPPAGMHQLAPAGVGLVARKRLTGEPLDQIDDQKQDNRAKCGRNNGANNASAEGQTEP